MESLDLSRLLRLADGMPAYARVREELQQGASTETTVLDAAKPFVIAALYADLARPMLVVTAHAETARRTYDQLLTWYPSGDVRLFPEPDSLPYERAISDSPSGLERLQVLSALAGGTGNPAPPMLVVASAAAFMQKTAPREDFALSFHTVRVGMEVDPMRLLAGWLELGYRVESLVEVPGTASRRGGILDVFPPTSDEPVRLEFFGNTVESIRQFDPATQRSRTGVESVQVGPATELLTPLTADPSDVKAILDAIDVTGCTKEMRDQFLRETATLASRQLPPNAQFYAPLFNRDSLLDYVPPDAILMLDDVRGIELAVGDLVDKAEELRVARLERGELPAGMPGPQLSWDELAERMGGRQRLVLTSWAALDDESGHQMDFAPAPNYSGQLPSFLARVKHELGERKRVVLVSHQAARLSELLEEEDIIAPALPGVRQAPPAGSLVLVQGLLSGGWTMANDVFLLTDAEIFGFIKQQRLQRRRQVSRHKIGVDIRPGDYVVHIEHGIAQFTGFRKMRTESGDKEFLSLRYAAGDRVYVPSDQADRVARYIGGTGDQAPTLSRLGTQEWSRTKQRAKQSVEEMAEELLELYASREVVEGYAYSPDAIWQREMEASFPYVETMDQIAAQTDVKEDMERDKPMDRLICGDVGYGKTEVALRAAFKAVLDGKQVAVLVPTTVLAQQHYVTFKERMEAFPVTVEMLSRFRSHREQEVVVEGLASGGVDICIGTHRLLQKDIAFKDIGLLIIDEEQRFGVAHKEFLKQMRKEVDVLALSATPIPRTLHMGLVGVRDMSTMETPPEERLPIRTYVAEYDERLIREAIIRELERDGQVFFVHNRVRSIGWVASALEEIIPEATIAIAHGQMPEHQLEQVTADFVAGKADILLCTTIIESGLDMPNVNTLIVNRADKFGLTQLYQLRGRVGRGSKLAYAYLLHDKGQRLTPVAEKRLRTIYAATELGAGFGIAMADLEIRGAGTLLGTRQSGHIAAVGFHLYTQLLTSAVETLKARKAGEPVPEAAPSHLPMPSIDLPLEALIPEDYVSDLMTRLGIYQDLARLDRLEQVDLNEADFRDRFGPLPEQVQNLLYAIRVKLLGARAHAESVTAERGDIVVRLLEGLRLDRRKLAPFIRDGISVGNTQLRMTRRRLGQQWRALLLEILERMRD
jgi:transcription-repair coupling factor (superfamily II helicase)